MPFEKFDRKKLKFKSLKERKNKVVIARDHVSINGKPINLSAKTKIQVKQLAYDIKKAREKGKSVLLAFGAHTIKNGLSPVLIKLIEEGWFTHLATNGIQQWA